MSQKGAGGKLGEFIFKITRTECVLIGRVHSWSKTWKSWKSNRSEMRITPHPTQAGLSEREAPHSPSLWPGERGPEAGSGPQSCCRGCRKMGRRDGPLQLSAWLPGGGARRGGGASAGLVFVLGSEEGARAPALRERVGMGRESRATGSLEVGKLRRKVRLGRGS